MLYSMICSPYRYITNRHGQPLIRFTAITRQSWNSPRPSHPILLRTPYSVRTTVLFLIFLIFLLLYVDQFWRCRAPLAIKIGINETLLFSLWGSCSRHLWSSPPFRPVRIGNPSKVLNNLSRRTKYPPTWHACCSDLFISPYPPKSQTTYSSKNYLYFLGTLSPSSISPKLRT